ncbi:hypothetical protein DPV78_007951 [Talaromyces pinophilus]|nr:hypothetical protein DPV78_007951 [Talaromyces pinophilus]
MESRQEYPLDPISNGPASPVSPVNEGHRAPESRLENVREHEDTYQHEEVPGYEERHRTQDVPPSYQHRDPVDTTVLRVNFSIWIPTAIYVVIVVWSWTTICIIAREPAFTFDKDLRSRQYYAARVVQSVASVATIPIISAVCACAAAIYVQDQQNEHSLSLRQVMALADREWMNPLCLIMPVSKRLHSNFLFLAIFIHIIGAITYPIQWLLLHVEEKPLYVSDISYRDAYHMNPPVGQISGIGSKGWAVVSLRKQLEGGYLGGQHTELWGNVSRMDMYTPESSWLTELPANYNTGAHRSIAPRYNSSTSTELVLLDEFPANCSSVPVYFYASLNYTDSSDAISSDNVTKSTQIQVCITSNLTTSPWSATNARQEITESLYIHINTSYSALRFGSRILNNTYKIIMNTTAGWFELPNMWNNGVPGPILENPNVTCDTSSGCIDASDPAMAASATFYPYKRSDDDPLGDWLYYSNNLLGPLATIAVAIFGPGSWFDTQQLLFPNTISPNETGWTFYLDDDARYKKELLLLASLTRDDYNPYSTGSQIYEWLDFFIVKGHNTSLPQALTGASFYAMKALINSNERPYYTPNPVVKVDYETVVMPSISLAGIIVVSVLLALYLIPLLALALYAGLSKSWTTRLDSFVMLRMGAAAGQRNLPMQIGKSHGKIGILDDLPGVVRDVSAPDDKIRQIALGAGGARLRQKAKYPAYPGNKYEPYGVVWY